LRAEIVGERPPQFALRLRQMHELAIFPVVADAVQSEIAAAAAALREWPGHPPTPLLLGLCDVLRTQVAGLRPTGAA
jgi:octaprenyl-diphosphate synthase